MLQGRVHLLEAAPCLPKPAAEKRNENPPELLSRPRGTRRIILRRSSRRSRKAATMVEWRSTTEDGWETALGDEVELCVVAGGDGTVRRCYGA
jgi:hypothetical protein